MTTTAPRRTADLTATPYLCVHDGPAALEVHALVDRSCALLEGGVVRAA